MWAEAPCLKIVIYIKKSEHQGNEYPPLRAVGIVISMNDIVIFINNFLKKILCMKKSWKMEIMEN